MSAQGPVTSPARPSRRTRLIRASMALGDVGCWFLATAIVASARYDFVHGQVPWGPVLLLPVVASLLQIGVGWLVRLYRGRAMVGSYAEVRTLIGIVVGTSLLLFLVSLAVPIGYPRGLGVSVPFGALLLMMAGRLLVRRLRGRYRLRCAAPSAEPVLIYGAGNAGTQLSRLLAEDPHAPFRVVGFLEDDPDKRYLHVGESHVVGTRADLVPLAGLLGARTVILAIPTADAAFVRSLSSELSDAGLKLLVLPPVSEMVGGRVQVSHLREVDLHDLLGRRPIETDLTAISGYLAGKVVLITGAGGSIGSEIARQVHAFGPRELVCLDRDESALHAVQLSIYHQGLLDTPDMVLCDIRDHEALDRIFARHKPDVVFHAAALKHLPLLEQYRDEGWKTNVLGTFNVLRCAAAHGVRRLVNISTDKAADPSSVLGQTKRNAERMTSWFAHQGHGSYVSVRFGNVLGSRGSVLWTFRSQIESGGPVTVVHPEVTRFFMTIPEACQLVIQAGALGDPGDVMVLDMGEPVKILDVARQLVRASERDIPIEFTGLRPGEKLHEVLFSEAENPAPMDHPLIHRVQVPAASPEAVLAESPCPLRTGALRAAS